MDDHDLEYLLRDYNCYEKPVVTVMARFMEYMVKYFSKWQIKNGDLSHHLLRITSGAAGAYKKTPRVYYIIEAIREILGNFELIKPDLQKVYDILADPCSWRSLVVVTDEANSMEFLESLLNCTADLLDSPDYSNFHLKKELQVVDSSLRVLRFFHDFNAKEGDVDLQLHKDLLTHVQAAVFNIACLVYFCCGKKCITELDLQKIKPVQTESRQIYIKALKAMTQSPRVTLTMDDLSLSFLDSILETMMELSESSKLDDVKDQILKLKMNLRYIAFLTVDPLWQVPKQIVDDLQLQNLNKHAKTLTIEAGYVIYSLYDAIDNDEMASEPKSALSSLLENVDDVLPDIWETYDKLFPRSLRSNFPRTNFRGMIGSLLQNMVDLVKDSEAEIDSSIKSDFELVQEKLACLRDEFNEIAMVPREMEELNHLWMRFNDVIHQTEYVIELFLVRGSPTLNITFGIFQLREDIEMIRTELKDVHSKMSSDDPLVQELLANNPNQVSSGLDSLPNDVLLISSDIEVDRTKNPAYSLVSFHDGEERILDQLTSGEQELQIVSIVGLPGIGKTTLAASLYDHPSVISCFHVRAKVIVSKVYERRRLLLDILLGVTGDIKKLDKKSDEDLEQILYQSLKGRRYLILMDDTWDINPWFDIKACFQDGKTGSRIMFTSRSLDIASKAKQDSVTYQLKLLSTEESWEMLRSKLFVNKETCPPELQKVGQEIAQSCKGLPLTIDLIAGVLRSIEQKEISWRLVAENIRAHIADDPLQRCQKALELSYKDLPDHLKPCFLYFGAFPEDAQVSAKRLTWHWIAEGFIQLQKAGESLEKTAEAYLNHLISRSLVNVSKSGSMGRVKASQMHDLLHDFASRKAEEEFFLLQMKGQTNEGYRMVCDSENWKQINGSRPFCSRVRSIFLQHRIGMHECQFLMSYLERYRLVRVLDLQGIEGNDFDPDTISLMVYLKFIALSGKQDWILDLLPQFNNLETILLVGRRLRIFSVGDIWNLMRLRHFCIGHCVFQLLRTNMANKNFQFPNLLSLSTPRLGGDDGETERMLRKLPNLQKLSCAVLDSLDYKKKCNLFPTLDFLQQLCSLKMVYIGKFQYPVGDFSFPPYLKKLTLTEFRLPWSKISSMAKLQHLEVLKLRTKAFEGGIWNMKDGDFPKLKVLSLCKLDVEKWNADEVEDELPPLERLEVFDCKNLVELPSCLQNIPTLEVIWLWQCSSSLEISAAEIVEVQKDTGNEELEIKQGPPSKTGWRDRMDFLSLHR